jgi:uncharacterized protein YcfJ
MKKLAFAIASLFTLAAPLTHAAYDRYGNYYEPRAAYDSRDNRGDNYARVIESKPVYSAAGSREECWNPRAGHYEERRDTHDSTNNGTAIGAIAGGVIGHQVDSGAAGTIGGAILGGLAGHEIDRRNNSNAQDDLDYSRCRVASNGDGALQGYEVRYVYNGQEYVTRMSSDPGRRLLVGRDIREDGSPMDSAPASYSYSQPYWR